MISAPRISELYWEPTRGGRYVHICDCRANWAAIDLRLGPSHGPIQGVKPRATSKGGQRGLPMPPVRQTRPGCVARHCSTGNRGSQTRKDPRHTRTWKTPRFRASGSEALLPTPVGQLLRHPSHPRAWGWPAVQSELGDGIS